MKMKSEMRNPEFETRRASAAFTLIELLVVIAVMAILAALVIPISGAVNRNKIRSKAKAQLEQIATGIELYKAKLGHYPPDNRINPGMNQLYFELLGTTVTNVDGKKLYSTLDGSARITDSTLSALFNAGGIINSSQGTGGDEGRSAASFISVIKPDQIATITNALINQNPPFSEVVKIFISGTPSQAGGVNTVYYVSSSPTNNPNSYDLWVDVLINGKTNRLSNWNKEPIIFP